MPRALAGTAAALRRVPPLARVSAVIAVLLATSAALLPGALAAVHPAAPFHLPWPLLTVLFALVEVCVLHVQVRREAQTVSLCEIPLLMGLFFCDAGPLLLARLVGPLLVFVFIRKQAPVKLAYNAALLTANASLAIVVFAAFSTGPGT